MCSSSSHSNQALLWAGAATASCCVLFRLARRLTTDRKLYLDDFLIIAAWMMFFSSTILSQRLRHLVLLLKASSERLNPLLSPDPSAVETELPVVDNDLPTASRALTAEFDAQNILPAGAEPESWKGTAPFCVLSHRSECSSTLAFGLSSFRYYSFFEGSLACRLRPLKGGGTVSWLLPSWLGWPVLWPTIGVVLPRLLQISPVGLKHYYYSMLTSSEANCLSIRAIQYRNRALYASCAADVITDCMSK